jgi:ribosomal protein S6
MHELTFIADPNLSEENLAGLLARIKGYIETQEGRIARNFLTRKSRLAYPVKKQTVAALCSVDFEIERGAIEGLTKEIKEEKNILRHIIINKKIIKPRPLTLKPAKIPAKTKQTKQAKIKIEELDKKLEEILQE